MLWSILFLIFFVRQNPPRHYGLCFSAPAGSIDSDAKERRLERMFHIGDRVRWTRSDGLRFVSRVLWLDEEAGLFQIRPDGWTTVVWAKKGDLVAF